MYQPPAYARLHESEREGTLQRDSQQRFVQPPYMNSNASLQHSTSTSSLASIDLPPHVHVYPSSSVGVGVNPHLTPNPDPTTPQIPTSAGGGGKHRRRESRFLAAAALIDAQNEAALLASSVEFAQRGSSGSSFAVSLLQGTPPPQSNDPVSNNGIYVAPTSQTEKLMASLTAPSPPTGYSLLDQALARKKKKLLEILQGRGGAMTEPVNDKTKRGKDDGEAKIIETRPGAISPEEGIDAPKLSDDDEFDEDVLYTYEYLNEDEEVKLAEDAKVDRLLKYHKRNMEKTIPLDVQLNLGRMHYEQFMGNFKPTPMEYAHTARAARDAAQRQVEESHSSSKLPLSARTSKKTHLLSQPLPFASLPAPRKPGSYQSLHGGDSHHSSTTSLLSNDSATSSNFSSRIKKITFLTQSLSDSSLTLEQGRRAMASVNEPMATAPTRSFMFFPYGDRFDTGEIQLLNQEMLGALGNESVANVIPVSSLKPSSMTSTLYRTPKHSGLHEETLDKLRTVNWQTPGPGAHIGNSVDTREQGYLSGAFILTADRLNGNHAADARLSIMLHQDRLIPGPGAYHATKDHDIRGMAAKAKRDVSMTNRNAAPMSHQDRLQEVIETQRRNVLDVQLNKFTDFLKASSKRVADANRTPGPAAYFPRQTKHHIRGAVALKPPQLKLQLEPDRPSQPEVGHYNPGTMDRFGNATFASHVPGEVHMHLSAKASLAHAGAKANFVGFGSSTARNVTLGTKGNQSVAVTTGGTRTERLVDFAPMPRITQRDLELIKADERGILLATPDESPTPTATNAAQTADLSTGAVLAPTIQATTQASESLLRRSRFGALLLPERQSKPHSKLITLRPPHIVPKFIIPRQILASKDEALKIRWLRMRAQHNNDRQMKAYEKSYELKKVRKLRFIDLQERDARIQAKNVLRIVQQRWLVLLVHAWCFSAYRSHYEASHQQTEKLKAALVLQYYWRLKVQRLMSSQRFQTLFGVLRRNFGFFVIQHRIRKKKRHMALLIRFLQDHVANTGEKKLYNVVQRFKHCVRVLQRFMRRSLQKIHAQIEVTIVQMNRDETRQNQLMQRVASNTKPTHHPTAFPSIRDQMVSEIARAREQLEEERIAMLAAKAAANGGAHGGVLKKGVAGLRKAVQAVSHAKAFVKGGVKKDETGEEPTNSKLAIPHTVKKTTFTSDALTHGNGILVRAGNGRSKVVPLFEAVDHAHASTVANDAKVVVTTLAEMNGGLQLSEGVKRAIAVEACRLRRKRLRVAFQRHVESMEKYLTRHGSALHSGIELARVLLTGSSEKIEADKRAFMSRYSPPFTKAVFERDEMLSLIRAAYALQAHVEEERHAARDPLNSRVAQGHSRWHPGCITVGLRHMLKSQSSLPLQVQDVSQIGVPINDALQMLQIALPAIAAAYQQQLQQQAEEWASSPNKEWKDSKSRPHHHDVYSWKSHDQLPNGIFSLRAALLAARHIAGPAIQHLSLSHIAPAVPPSSAATPTGKTPDPYWEVHSHGVMSAIGLHLTRSRALKESQAHIFDSNSSRTHSRHTSSLGHHTRNISTSSNESNLTTSQLAHHASLSSMGPPGFSRPVSFFYDHRNNSDDESDADAEPRTTTFQIRVNDDEPIVANKQTTVEPTIATKPTTAVKFALSSPESRANLSQPASPRNQPPRHGIRASMATITSTFVSPRTKALLRASESSKKL